MKTRTLAFLALLITVAAWLSLQGVSQATDRNAPEVPASAAPATSAPAPHPPRPASVKAAPAAAPSLDPAPPSALQVALQHALEAGDVCETSRLLEGSISGAEMYGALLAVIEPGAELLEAYGPGGPMLAAATDKGAPKTKSAAARALWALKTGGLLYAPVSSQGQNVSAARDLLLALEKQESGNAFYPYFRLILEDKLGLPAEQLKATAEAVAAGSSFDSHVADLMREIREGSWRNPAVHYAVNYFHSSGVFPFYEGVRILKRLAGDSHFSGLDRVAQLMAEQGARATKSSHEDGFDSSQYAAAHQLDPRDVKSLGDLNKEKGRTEGFYGPGLSHHEENGVSVCDPSEYEKFFFEAREAR